MGLLATRNSEPQLLPSPCFVLKISACRLSLDHNNKPQRWKKKNSILSIPESSRCDRSILSRNCVLAWKMTFYSTYLFMREVVVSCAILPPPILPSFTFISIPQPLNSSSSQFCCPLEHNTGLGSPLQLLWFEWVVDLKFRGNCSATRGKVTDQEDQGEEASKSGRSRTQWESGLIVSIRDGLLILFSIAGPITYWVDCGWWLKMEIKPVSEWLFRGLWMNNIIIKFNLQ